MSVDATQHTEADVLAGVFAYPRLMLERGEGSWLVSVKGERYLDFGAGIAVASLGYGNTHLVEALTKQASKLWHTSNLYHIPDGERLAQWLVDASFAEQLRLLGEAQAARTADRARSQETG